MNSLRRSIQVIAVICVLTIAFVLVFLKVPEASPDNVVKVHGIIAEISASGGENDIVFKLKDHSNWYLINRGLEKGLHLDSLRAFALNREADLYLVKMRMNLISPNHIAKVVSGGRILYDQMKGEGKK